MSDKWQVQLQRRAQDQVGTQTPVRAHPDRADQSEEESQENCATYLKVSKIPCRIGRGYRMLQSRKVQALASFSQQRCVVDSKPRQFEHGINLEYNRMYNFLRQYFQSYRNGKYLQFGVFLDENSKHDIIANFGQSLTKEWLVLANHVALPKVQSELLGQQCKLYVVGQVRFNLCFIQQHLLSFKIFICRLIWILAKYYQFIQRWKIYLGYKMYYLYWYMLIRNVRMQTLYNCKDKQQWIIYVLFLANITQKLTGMSEYQTMTVKFFIIKKALKPQDDVRIIAIEDCLKQQHFQRISNSKSVYLNYFVQHSPFLVNAFFLSFLICCQRNKLFWSSSQSLTLLIQTVGANEDYVGF
eukprot:TRINITY_DN603_c1_g1_i6.p1 TRINITY_DN603_c1_g1~~TRINITY_DN603_c1_g1_i6.p1  ORF type:complete len:355 (+),score=-7.78 TRINITY_DN603_c1_g1_i6:155-1219(+)